MSTMLSLPLSSLLFFSLYAQNIVMYYFVPADMNSIVCSSLHPPSLNFRQLLPVVFTPSVIV